jgi:hypothetical protein
MKSEHTLSVFGSLDSWIPGLRSAQPEMTRMLGSQLPPFADITLEIEIDADGQIECHSREDGNPGIQYF